MYALWSVDGLAPKPTRAIHVRVLHCGRAGLLVVGFCNQYHLGIKWKLYLSWLYLTNTFINCSFGCRFINFNRFKLYTRSRSRSFVQALPEYYKHSACMIQHDIWMFYIQYLLNNHSQLFTIIVFYCLFTFTCDKLIGRFHKFKTNQYTTYTTICKNEYEYELF